MPIFPSIDAITGRNQEPRRKKKKRGFTDIGPPSTPAEAVTPGEVTDRRARRLAIVEQESGGTLPSTFSMALVDHNSEEKQLRRAARLMSKEVDVKVRDLFGPKQGFRNYEDPIHGGRMRLSTARRLTKKFTKDSIVSMLRNQMVETPDGPMIQFPGVPARASDVRSVYVKDRRLRASAKRRGCSISHHRCAFPPRKTVFIYCVSTIASDVAVQCC